MSRSAKDATRFTATVPHAYSKPGASPSSQLRSGNGSIPPNGGRPGETPQQKVARLRAAHDAKKMAQFSAWDRVVVRGRMIADAAHRFTVMGLVGLTVIAGGVTVFSLGDMILHNRRKRKEYFDEQTKLRAQRITEARAAAAMGQADEDQVLLLNQEQAKQESEETKRNQKGIIKRTTNWIFSTDSLKKEDKGDTALGFSMRNEGAIQETKEEAAELVERTRKLPEESSILQAVEEKRREGERELQSRGIESGTLDKMAEGATSAAAQKSKGWTGWMTRS